MAIKTFILAAGLGTRLRPYTNILPKPAIPFMGIPLIGHAMYLAHLANSHELVINTHLFPQKISKVVHQLKSPHCTIEESAEYEEPLGSGGALFKAQSYLKKDSSFLVINGDTVFIPKNKDFLNTLQTEHHTTNSLCTLVVSERADLVARFNPLWIDDQNRLVGVGQKPQGACRPAHYMGIKIFNSSIFSYTPPGISQLFSDILLPALRKGERISVLPQEGYWWETGDFSSYFQATIEAMQLIKHNKDLNYFSQIYDHYKKSMTFEMIEQGTDIQFIHKKSGIRAKNVSGSAFIDELSTNPQSYSIKNSVISKDCEVTQSLSQALLIKDIV